MSFINNEQHLAFKVHYNLSFLLVKVNLVFFKKNIVVKSSKIWQVISPIALQRGFERFRTGKKRSFVMGVK